MPRKHLIGVIALILITGSAFAETIQIKHHDLTVSIDPAGHALKGMDRISLTAPITSGTLRFHLHRGLTVTQVRDSDGALAFEQGPAMPRRIDRVLKVTVPEGKRVIRLTIAYSGEIYDPVEKSSAMGFVRGDNTSGLISEKGVFLHGGTLWYPRGDETLAQFDMAVTVPQGWMAVSEGNLVDRSETKAGEVTTWKPPIPIDGPTLAANRFKVYSKTFGKVTISSFFLEADARLGPSYVNQAGKYLAFYEELLGPYPFNRFDIVENFFTTGYGMPGYTLLGPMVVKMAHFGAKTLGPHSLGHELVHNWWGNGVFVPRGRGNWCEALTTYCANYFWVERFEGEEKARDYRRRAFLKYAIFVDEKNDYPVMDFGYKSKEVDDFIGYTKGSMVLHLLRLTIGDTAFFEGLRTVRRDFLGKIATWDDFRKAFEIATGSELKPFFDQWIHGTWAPTLSLQDVEAVATDTGYAVRARVVRVPEKFAMRVPVVLTTERGTSRRLIDVGPGSDRLDLACDARPVRLEIDPAFEAFRRIHPSAIHPCLELTLSHDSALVVVPTGGTDGERKFYEGIARRYQGSSRKLPYKKDTDLTRADLEGRSLLILGGPRINGAAAKVAAALTGEDFELDASGFSVKGKRFDHPGNSALVSMVSPFEASRHVTLYVDLSAKGMQRAGLMAHYGWESYLVYDARKPREVVLRGDFEALRAPDSAELALREGSAKTGSLLGVEEVQAYRYSDRRTMSLQAMVEDLAGFDVVFVGEAHNDWATHRVEHGILEGLARLGTRDLAVAWEMFERDVQPVLDAYVAGEIDESEFMKKARPWPNHIVGYRPIVESCRRRKIPMIAGNIPRRLASIVARQGEKGLDGLSEQDRAYAARQLRAPEGPYRDKVLRVMTGGMGGANAMAQRFYLAQCIKDDTMAESVADFLAKPGRRGSLVVHYNGSFHSDGHLGVPEKLKNLVPGLKIAVIKVVPVRDLLHADPEELRGEADYLVMARRRGEDHQDGTYSYQVPGRMEFTCALPPGFTPGSVGAGVVVFHQEGSSARAAKDLWQAWGIKEVPAVFPQGSHPVWKDDGTPGYAWMGADPRGEDADRIAALGDELLRFLTDTLEIPGGGVRILALSDGMTPAMICASSMNLPEPRVALLDPPGRLYLPAAESPGYLTLIGLSRKPAVPRNRSSWNIRSQGLDSVASMASDGAGDAVIDALLLERRAWPKRNRKRTLLLALDSSNDQARTWAFRTQKRLEAMTNEQVGLHVAGGKVSLADRCMALRLKGVESVVIQPLELAPASPPDLKWPEWAEEDMNASVTMLPALSVEEVLRNGLPPNPRSRFAAPITLVVLAETGDVQRLKAAVKAAGDRRVSVIAGSDTTALAGALTARGAGGMPGMMGMSPKVYVLGAGFAADKPVAFLPALVRHGDPDRQVRSGLGCLDMAKVILARLK